MSLTIGDLYEFSLKHKADKTFIGYSNATIAEMVRDKVEKSLLWYTTDDKNRITGMILASLDYENNILFIDENLAMNKENLRRFARRARIQFNGYTLKWFKNGRYKTPNTERTYAKLS